MATFDVPVSFTLTIHGTRCVEVEAADFGEARRLAARRVRADLDHVTDTLPAGATVDLAIDNSFVAEAREQRENT